MKTIIRFFEKRWNKAKRLSVLQKSILASLYLCMLPGSWAVADVYLNVAKAPALKNALTFQVAHAARMGHGLTWFTRGA